VNHAAGERIDSEIQPFIEKEEELRKIQNLKNRPLYILRVLSQEIHDDLYRRYDASLAIKHDQHFDDPLHTLGSALAGCERIVKQPIPLAYSRHTSRFLSFYMATLPLSLISYLGWMSPLVVALMDWSFVSIMEIGHFIEEPFNKDIQIIPLNLMVSVIRSEVSEILDGVVSSPQFEKFDQKMLESAKGRSRMRDDSWFAFY
jgi:ion channel-forming bestrophin family protein